MPDLLIQKDGPVVVLTMNRPARRNAMTLAMFARLADAWDEIDADTDVRVCILTGAGDHFSAGMDLRAMAGDVDDGDDYEGDVHTSDHSPLLTGNARMMQIRAHD